MEHCTCIIRRNVWKNTETLRKYPAVDQPYYSVCSAAYLPAVCCHYKSGIEFTPQLQEELQYGFAAGGVEVAGRLIGKDNLRVVNQGPAKGYPLLFAARQLVREIIIALEQVDAAEQFCGLGGRLGITVQFGREHDVFQGGQGGDQVEGLKHVADCPVAERRELVFAQPA